MRLKRVRIFGFKTFADRTEVNLDGGIIAVVGPNGCGKSNLVDAILWALGESNARHLRASASQDVIFSGSARRKPVGYAEVSLLFDNEDSSLPIDTPEVTVTRRLNRAGDSEYFINRRSCRQRDIHELLADSGLGRAGYAIVGQKEIDQALAASPEDRRAWVDEAAGVQRYRARKIESVKRLASAKDHLVRVDDILRELESQREPLSEEAEVAKRYRIAADALREVETGLLIQELAKSAKEVAELEARLSSAGDLVHSEAKRAEDLESQSQLVREQIAELDHRMEAIRGRLADAITAGERADAGARLGDERLRSLAELEETLRNGNADVLAAEALADAEAAKEEARIEEDALSRARSEVGGVGDEAKQLSEKLRQADAALVAARQAHALRLKQQAEQEHRAGRRVEAERELAGIDQDLPSLLDAKQVADAETTELAAQLEVADQNLKSVETQLADLRKREDADSAHSRSLLAEKAALEGRRRGIEATIQAHEGLAQGSRAVVDAASRGILNDVYTPVGQALTAKKDHALAIETALGAAANDLIVDHEGAAKTAIRYLRENRLGRATFQPIPLMRPSDVHSELRRVLTQKGVIGRASELVDCEPAHRPVIDSLLGRVVIVGTLDDSLRLAKTNGWARLVTLDGEVVHASGAVAGGQSGKQQYGLVQRRADLEAIESDLRSIEREVKAAEKRTQEAERLRAELQVSLEEARAEVDRRRLDLRESRDYLQTLSSEVAAAEKSREKLQREMQGLDSQIVLGEAVDVEGLQAERDAIMNELASRSADANLAKERLCEAELRWQQAKARLNSAQKRLESATHTEAQRAARLENLEPERQKVRADIERHRADHARAESSRKHAEADLRERQADKDKLLNQAVALTEEAKQVRANVAAMADANHQAELSRARAEARRAGAAERLMEEYGITPEDAMSQAETVEVPPDAQPIANRLRREIRAMGIVNLGAIEAYDRLTSRSDELSAQRADIVEGIEQVQASMRELDKLTRDRFMDTFSKVQEAYSQMFQKLFGGGEGRIFLENADSILESGIEIEVTLPGKKRQRLELLSGGERALCASGFLFALLEVKPSPLVVLDEVDAPLDGRNVERFGDVLQQFTDRTQFIVITHNPTTIERAPVWLGVTMQEPGVSTLVPARLPTAPTSAVVETAPTQLARPVLRENPA